MAAEAIARRYRRATSLPVGAIYSEAHLPDGSASGAKYNPTDPNKGHDHTFSLQHSRDAFAD